MSTRPLTAGNGTYTPATPLTATYTTVLSQDVVTTDTVPVDSTSPSPVAVFTNPAANNQAEAVAIVNVSQGGTSTPQLCHVARDSSAGGWSVTPLFGGRTAQEVVAGTASPGTGSAATFAFFADDTALYAAALQTDGTWSDPQTVYDDEAVANLNVASSPTGALVLYGRTTDGDLLTAYQQNGNGSFVASVTNMLGGLPDGDFRLCMTDELDWMLVANVSAQPVYYTGTLRGGPYASQNAVSGFQGQLQQVVLDYWSASQSTWVVLFVDTDNTLQVWSTKTTQSIAVQAIPNSNVASAAGYVDTNGNLHVYSIDTSTRLWVLHQDPNTPWSDSGAPNWGPYIALDSGIAAVASDMNPADAPTLFVLDSTDYSLRLHTQDPTTSMWRSGPVLQAATQAYEVTRFRTEVSVRDANGIPLPNCPVSLSVQQGCSACDIEVAGTTYPVSSDAAVSLSTDATGRITLAILATAGMAAPNLVVTADGLTDPFTVMPAGGIHTYLSGQGTLNPTNPTGPLPVFDANGQTLAAAKVNGGWLAPSAQGNSQLAQTAAQAIQNAATVGLGTTPEALAGYEVILKGRTGPRYTALSTADEVTARLAALRDGLVGDIWGDIGDWAGDVWEGIKNGVIAISNFIVDVGKGIVTLAVKIGDEIEKGVKLALKGVEQAAHFIAGVFQAVAAKIEDVIDWLKALFDFAAIWRTKMAFEQALNAAPTYVVSVLALSQQAADGWFSKQIDVVNDAFTKIIDEYDGKTFGGLPNWQQPGQPPSTSPIAGGASPADFSNNVHHNWLQDKIASHAPSSVPITPQSALQSAWSAFETNASDAVSDLSASLKSFGDGIADIIKSPTDLGSMAIPDLLKAVQELVVGVLKFCDALVDLIVALGDAAMDALQSLLTTELDLGVINTLWSWIAKAAGYPTDDKLTVSALVSLLGGFACTVLYKLILGVDKEPFPDGQLPFSVPGATTETARAGVLGAAVPQGCILAAAVLQVIYVVPALIAALLGDDCPWWMTLFTLGLSVVMWVLANGLPDLSTLEWTAAAVVVANLLWIAPTVYFVIQAVASQFLEKVSAVFGDVANTVISVYGLGNLILAAVLDILQPPDSLKVAANFLLPLPSLFAFLQLSVLRKDPIVAPFAVGATCVVDLVGYVGGGICLVMDATES